MHTQTLFSILILGLFLICILYFVIRTAVREAIIQGLLEYDKLKESNLSSNKFNEKNFD